MNDRSKNPYDKNPEWMAHWHAPENQKEAQADLDRRLRAAGMGPDDDEPADMEEFRNRLARKIHMYLNDWPGCPEKICHRNRGCMAPHGTCANAADEPPFTEEEWITAKTETRLALDEIVASLGGRDALEELADAEIAARRAKKAARG